MYNFGSYPRIYLNENIYDDSGKFKYTVNKLLYYRSSFREGFNNKKSGKIPTRF